MPRLALCADGFLADATPALARHFVAAETKHFGARDLDAAIDWAAGSTAEG